MCGAGAEPAATARRSVWCGGRRGASVIRLRFGRTARWPAPSRWRTWGLRAATPTPGHLKVRAEVLEIVGLKRFMGCKGLLSELC